MAVAGSTSSGGPSGSSSTVGQPADGGLLTGGLYPWPAVFVPSMPCKRPAGYPAAIQIAPAARLRELPFRILRTEGLHGEGILFAFFVSQCDTSDAKLK